MKRLVTTMLSLCLLLSSLAYSESPIEPGKANSSALAWLSMTDAAQYSQSWEHAGTLVRKTVTKPQWQALLMTTREPMGAVQIREFKAAEATRVLPGAPEGQYMVIQYETQFEQGVMMIETVTITQENGGVWKVIGYFIKGAQ